MGRITKQFLGLTLVPLLALLCLALPVEADAATAASGSCGENVTWRFDESTGTLTISGSGPMENYTFSNKAPWIDYHSEIQNVVVESGVTSVGDYSFHSTGNTEYTNFTDLTLADTVTSIGFSAFWNCSSLTGDLVIPDSVTGIGGYAFENCSGLTGKLVLPDSVTSIGSGAFNECSGLTGDLVIPTGITGINDYTFGNCSSMTGTLVIPEGVTGIGESAFSNCTGLTGSLKIPDTVTSIGYAAFYNCSSLTGELVIPKRVTSIGDYAFHMCTSLTQVTVGEGVTEIPESAFDFCLSLEQVVLPGGLTTIRNRAFADCRSLTEITFTGKAPTINTEAFLNVEATAYYPADDATWAEEVRQNYGGTITWVPYETTTDDTPEDLERYPSELRWFFRKLNDPDNYLWASGTYTKLMEKYGEK